MSENNRRARFYRLTGLGRRQLADETTVAMSVVLVAIALMASYVPARRATRVEPTLAMRAE